MISPKYTFLISIVFFKINNHFVSSTRVLETPAAASSYYTMFQHGVNQRKKEVIYDIFMANQMVNCDKPEGLHRTILDLKFPEDVNDRTTVYRLVQYVLQGGVTELQRDLYRTVELSLEGVKAKNENQGPCNNEIVIKLSRPSTFDNNGFFVPEEEGVEKRITFAKDAKMNVTFENVFDDDFPMDHFWVNFSIYGKCNNYLDVTLVKPSNRKETL